MMAKWLRITLILLAVLFAVAVAFMGLVGILWSGVLNFLFPQEVATYESPDNEYTLVFEQVGSPFLFSPTHVRLTLKNSRGRNIDRVTLPLYNDGVNAKPNNIKSIHWGEHEVVVEIDHFDGFENQEIILSLP